MVHLETDIRYEDAVKWILSRVPEFKADYDDLSEFFGNEVGAHLVFAELGRFVIRALKSGDNTMVKKIMAAVEEVGSSPHKKTVELVQVSFLEVVSSYRRIRPQLAPIMGPRTKDLLDELDRFWSRK